MNCLNICDIYCWKFFFLFNIKYFLFCKIVFQIILKLFDVSIRVFIIFDKQFSGVDGRFVDIYGFSCVEICVVFFGLGEFQYMDVFF